MVADIEQLLLQQAIFKMSVRVGVVDFPIALSINQNRETFYDGFNGAYSYYLNGIIKFLKLNLTIVMTSDFGSCFANGTCDGLSGLLAENKVDFGIFPVDINYGPDVPVNSILNNCAICKRSCLSYCFYDSAIITMAERTN